MTVLNVENLTKSFSSGWGAKNTRLKNISLQIEKGEVFVLVGPNGSGKTTLTKLIVSLLEEDSGVIEVFGQKRKNRENQKQMGYLPEYPQFPLFLNARQLLKVACDLYNIPREEAFQRTNEVLSILEMTSFADKKIKEYSKGMLKRSALLKFLFVIPILLF